jgi:CRISPR/Cas system endoribonuclease Cas6 (RAMP superfamily)
VLKSLNEVRHRRSRLHSQSLPYSLASLNGKITGYEFRIVAEQARQFLPHINRGLAVRMF